MRAHTEFRLAALNNGYWVTLNNCKIPIIKRWQNQRPDEAEILSWDRSSFTSTGMKIDSDLAAIDVDAPDAKLVSALADAVEARFPALFLHGMVRHAGGPKEAWFCRVKTPFKQRRSRRWQPAGRDSDDPATPKFMVECFG
jgi:hypothetical protein